MAVADIVEVRAVVGEKNLGDGVTTTLRLNRTGALAVSQATGKYYEQTSRGNVFSLVLTAWTTGIAAGNILAAAAAASTQFALWNPVGSGKNLSLLKFGVWPISGTSPVPAVFHSMSATAPTIASSAVTPVQNNCVGKAASSVAGYLTSAGGSNLTGSSALKVIRAANLYITAGTISELGGKPLIEEIDGDIVLAPGTCWVPTWAAAGTSVLGGYSITWEEIPI